MPPEVAGVTFLAFGNGAPDVFSSLVALTTTTIDKEAALLVGVGSLLGAGDFFFLLLPQFFFFFSVCVFVLLRGFCFASLLNMYVCMCVCLCVFVCDTVFWWLNKTGYFFCLH